MIDAQYAQGIEPSKYITLDESAGETWELDASKVCQINDPDCDSCQ